MMHVTNRGVYHTLIAQLDKLAKHNRHGSFKTRERYYDTMKRFCAFLADDFHLGKLSNIGGKHIEAYVAKLQERGRSAAYVKTELSAIRLYHDLMPDPRHKLPANDTLSLERRRFGEVDRTWTAQEYEAMRQQAIKQGRGDFADMLTLIRHAGLRLHECARLDTAATEGATRNGLLTVKGKGGKIRTVPVDAVALEVLHWRLSITRRGCKLFVPDDAKTDVVMNALEQFIIHHREDGRASGVALTIHGLRHTWAAEQYRALIAAGRSPLEARRQVSQWLGHERDSVTKMYLASLSEDEKKGGGAI